MTLESSRHLEENSGTLWAKKKFRKDLFFRLNVLRISIPSLQKRKEDIPLLFEYFLKYYKQKHAIEKINVTPYQMQNLVNYQWPGNIRQLKYFTERLVLHQLFDNKEEGIDKLILELYKIIEIPNNDLDENEIEKENQPCLNDSNMFNNNSDDMLPPEAKEIFSALKASYFNKGRAAKALGISRATLWRKMKKFSITC